MSFGSRTPIVLFTVFAIVSLHAFAIPDAHAHNSNKIVDPEIRALISPEDTPYFAVFPAAAIPDSEGVDGWRVIQGDSLTVQCLYDFVWFPLPGAEQVIDRGILDAFFEVEIIGVNAGPEKMSPVWAWQCETSLRTKAPPVRHFHDPGENGCNSIACFVVDVPVPLLTPNQDGPPSGWEADTVRTIVTMRYQHDAGQLDTTFKDTIDHPFYVLEAGDPTWEPHDCGLVSGDSCYSHFAPLIGKTFKNDDKPLADPGYNRVTAEIFEAAGNGDAEVGQPRILIAEKNKGWVDLFSRGDTSSPSIAKLNVHFYSITDTPYMKSGFDIFTFWEDSSEARVEMIIDTLRTSDGTWVVYQTLRDTLRHDDPFSHRGADSAEFPAWSLYEDLRIQLPSSELRTQDYRCTVRDEIWSPSDAFVAGDTHSSKLRVHWMVPMTISESVPLACYAPGNTMEIEWACPEPRRGKVDIYLDRCDVWNPLVSALPESLGSLKTDSLRTWDWIVDTDTIAHWARLRVDFLPHRTLDTLVVNLSDTTEYFPIWTDCTDIEVENVDSACYGIGKDLTVRWDASPFTDTLVSIHVLRGAQWDTIATVPNGTAPDYRGTQEYVWTVAIPTNENCKIRVDMIPSGNSDTTEGFFKIRTGCGGGGSCPYVYSWDGSAFRLDNTILSKSGDSSSVSDRYLLTQKPVAESGRYRIEIREFETERSLFEDVRLVAIDHAPESELVLALGDRVVTFRDVTRSLGVRDHLGVDHRATVSANDQLDFEGIDQSHLEIEFLPGDFVIPAGKTATTGSAGIIQNLRQKAEPSIRVDLPTEDEPGSWNEIAVIHPREETSPFFTDLSPYLSSLQEDPRIRLRWTAKHSLDDVGLVWLTSDPLIFDTLAMLSASHSTIGDIAWILEEDGKKVELLPTEKITLEFEAPPLAAGLERDFLLMTMGLYSTYKEKVGAATVSVLRLSAHRASGASPLSIEYGLPKAGQTKLDVYAVSGRLVRTLVDRISPAGIHHVEWDGRNDQGATSASGVYFLRLQAGKEERTMKTVIIR